MKTISSLLLSFFIFTVFIISCDNDDDNKYGSGQTVKPTPEDTTSTQKPDTVVVLAYVTSWSSIIPDPAVLTHINYSFGHVSETYNGINIDNEDRMKTIVNLKNQNKSLKVLLSVGGWGSGRFSEMAGNISNRESFAKDCKRVIDEFDLDGIDIDWEFPTSNVAGISSSTRDTENFNLLMQEIRNAIGKNKLLTFASSSSGKYYNFATLAEIVDFVNIMQYNVNNPPYHHSALFRSSMVKDFSAEESIDIHVKAGIPIEKLVLGVPFYGIMSESKMSEISYKNILLLSGYTEMWDDAAKVPYLLNSGGEMVCSYDNAESIRYKCDYVKEHGMLGIMYWEYASDDDEGTLRNAVWNGMIN